MGNPRQYQLLDFGDGRRLERFGPLVLDRPCPAAEGIRRAAPWTQADARFDRGDGEQGQWTLRGEVASTWTINLAGKIGHPLVFELKRTDFGHVGLFPEQAENWGWLAEQLALLAMRLGRPPRLLNLFAHTGGSTLAAAAAGAEVTHVDAARNVTNWARRNAELSGLGAAPIRWIAEDAMKYVGREIRRGSRYDGFVLDPPSYGHGARGEVWQLDRHLPELLAACAELAAPGPSLMLLTCHTPGYTPERLGELLTRVISCKMPSAVAIQAAELTLRSATSRLLPCGTVARWAAGLGVCIC
jgi:23S rRNA (cytosine1962-C5)-methyltransferase